ncbi:MAG: response regulator transcription factor [Terracidiphilus sp.]
MINRYRPRIIIADDHTLIAEAFKGVLETEFDVVAVVNNGQALIDTVCRLNPDLALVDAYLPMLNGLDACEHIRRIKRTVKVVIVTTNADRDTAADAFRRGAFGVLPKTSTVAELQIAIRIVIKGERYVSPLIARDTFDLQMEFEGSTGFPGPLTIRQKQVVQLLAEGKSMKEVGLDLTVTPRTVAFHKYRVMHMLHLKSHAELIQYAMKEHMVAFE